jgi:hypothetical protein
LLQRRFKSIKYNHLWFLPSSQNHFFARPPSPFDSYNQSQAMLNPILLLAAIALAIPATFYSLHRLLLYFESRDWLYYRRKRPESSRCGGLLSDFQQLVEPQARQIEEFKAEQRQIQIDDHSRRR